MIIRLYVRQIVRQTHLTYKNIVNCASELKTELWRDVVNYKPS